MVTGLLKEDERTQYWLVLEGGQEIDSEFGVPKVEVLNFVGDPMRTKMGN